MGNTNTILLSPFYRALLQDFQSLYPDVSFTYEHELLDGYDSMEQRVDNAALCMVGPLCKLGKALEKSLVTPCILEIPDEIPRQEGTNLPRLLYGLFRIVFHDSGLRRHSRSDLCRSTEELSECATALTCLRQYLLGFSKLEDVTPDVDQNQEVIDFVDRVTDPGQVCALDPLVASVARRLLRIVLMDGEELCAPIAQWVENPWGRHGPGAVSGGEVGAEKWDFQEYVGLASEIFRGQYAHMPLIRDEGLLSNGVLMNEHRSGARLAIVPKDFRGHRLICVEPKEQMFAQQGLAQVLTDVIHSHPLTRRSISLNDQEKSSRLSCNYDYATIDLKDASDSLKIEVLRVLLPEKFYRLVSSLRSRGVELPDGDWIYPRTMFTMGNALCFPMETLVFWAVSLASMVTRSRGGLYALSGFENHSDDEQPAHPVEGWVAAKVLRRRFLNRFRLRVYGDDIIVPLHHSSTVVDALTRIGCTVNQYKTCADTLVRESCGSWLYGGYDASCVKFRFHKLENTRTWVSLLANAKDLLAGGFSNASLALMQILAVMHPVPFGTDGYPGHLNLKEGYRWNKELQRLEFRMPILCERDGPEVLPGRAVLYAAFTGQATRSVVHADDLVVKWIWAEARI